MKANVDHGLRTWVASGCVLGWLAFCGYGQVAETAQPASGEFLRFVKTGSEEGHIDTAVKTYRRADGVKVSLIAAVHVADRAYYQKLQKLFEGYDALLYEMIKDKEAEAAPDLRSESPISQLQVGIKTVLELEFQLDAIDYSKRNFVHADMDPETFFQKQQQKGESILTLMIRAILEESRRQANGQSPPFTPFQLLAALMQPDRAHALKFLLAQQLGNLESMLAGVDRGSKGDGSVLVSGRNQVAIDVLKEQMKKGRKQLGIFYGAGHMPDLEKRLHELGFKKIEDQWLTAWEIRKKKGPNPGNGQPKTGAIPKTETSGEKTP